MKYLELIEIGVETSNWKTAPSDEIPSATRFFEAVSQIDPTYFENASERLEIKDQHLYFLEAFGRFYCIDQDNEMLRFGCRFSMEHYLERLQVEENQETENRNWIQNQIDQHLLTA